MHNESNWFVVIVTTKVYIAWIPSFDSYEVSLHDKDI